MRRREGFLCLGSYIKTLLQSNVKRLTTTTKKSYKVLLFFSATALPFEIETGRFST